MLSDVMLDLETLGTKNDAHIRTIGACMFDPYRGIVDEVNTFYAVVDWDSQPERSIDAATVKWWMQQGPDSTKEILKPGRPLHNVLLDFRRWMPAKACIWSNGENFDIPILRNAYENDLATKTPPWHYTKESDVRTVVRVAKGIVDRPTVFEGVKHHALYDAIHQAKYICAMVMALRNRDSMVVASEESAAA